MIYKVGQKSKPDIFLIFYCQPIFIIFDTYVLKKFATGGCVVSPPNMVNVTALPYKILITALPIYPICTCSLSSIITNKKISVL